MPHELNSARAAGRGDKHGPQQERARAQGRDLDWGWRADAHFVYLILLLGVHQAYGVPLSQGPIHHPEGYYHALQATVCITTHLEQRPASPSCTPQASAPHHSLHNSTVQNSTAAYTVHNEQVETLQLEVHLVAVVMAVEDEGSEGLAGCVLGGRNPLHDCL